MYHQYLEAIWKERRVHINATKSQFQRDEGHLSEVVYFDELADKGEVAPPSLETFFYRYGRTSRGPDNFASLSLDTLDHSNNRSQIVRRGRGDDSLEKIHLADGE